MNLREGSSMTANRLFASCFNAKPGLTLRVFPLSEIAFSSLR